MEVVDGGQLEDGDDASSVGSHFHAGAGAGAGAGHGGHGGDALAHLPSRHDDRDAQWSAGIVLAHMTDPAAVSSVVSIIQSWYVLQTVLSLRILFR